MTAWDKTAYTRGTARGTIVGLFRNQADAEWAIRDLKDAGIDETRIGVGMRDRDGHRELPEGTLGRILGGAVGLLAGVGAVAIPGVGPIIVGGALASTLDARAAAGGLVEVLGAMGIPENDASYFEAGLRLGSVLVTVSAGSRAPEAREILRAYGADLGWSTVKAGEDPELFESRDQILVDAENWRGDDRRHHDDLSYAGPERRLSHR